jgi:flagella basal body P-ring formation protein FlgA
MRIGDVVVLDCIPAAEREALAALVIARAPSHTREIDMDRAALIRLVIRRAPRLGADLTTSSGSIRLRVSLRSEVEAERPCYAAARSLAPGEALRPSDVVASGCPGERTPSLRYDERAGLVRAARAIEAGEQLGGVGLPPTEFVERGDALTLVFRAGPVVVEREVRAAQSARAGEAVFVRDGDGRIFAAPFPQAAAGGAP